MRTGIHGNGIMSHNLKCRILDTTDLSDIQTAIHWQTHKYGYPMNHDEISKNFSFIVDGRSNGYLIGCYDGNQIIGINYHAPCTAMPFWSFASLIIKPNDNMQGIMTNRQTDILATLLEFNCALGESNNRYDWLTVTQDSTKMRKTRHYKIMDKIYDRYTGVDLDVVKPGEEFKWPYVGKLLGTKSFKNPLVIKMFSLKNHLRPTSWMNSDAT